MKQYIVFVKESTTVEIKLISAFRVMTLRSTSKNKATTAQTAKTTTVPVTMMVYGREFPRIVLDNKFVSEYLRKQNEDQSVSSADVISLADSTDDENEKSVVFVSEEKPPEVSPKTECDRLRKENKHLKNRMRKVEVHVEALQKHIIQQGQTSAEPIDIVPIENAATEIDPIENSPTENNPKGISSDLNISFDSEWVTNQIGQIQDEGNLSTIAAEMAKYMENE